jgi:hypothetical protein
LKIKKVVVRFLHNLFVKDSVYESFSTIL